MGCNKILLTGATGFVGNHITQELLNNNFEVHCLIRPGSENKLCNKNEVTIETGDITDTQSLYAAMGDCDAVINLVGIIREDKKHNITFKNTHCAGTKNCVDVAGELGITRFLHMSALGTRNNAPSQYHQSKYWAEEYVRNSSLNYTIFRPSMIFGPEDKSLNYFAQLLHKLPFFTVFGDGEYKLAPVSVNTIAEAYVQSINNPQTYHETYEVQGPETYTYNELLETIAEIVNKKPRLVHVPLPIARVIIRLIQDFSFAPITLEQLTMLVEGSTTMDNSICETLNLKPHSFKTEAPEYLGHP